MTPLAADFERCRKRLFGLAYRMLGSAADAEDIVQETYLRASQAAADEIRSPEAYFVTIATRLCLDQLKSARRQRESYIGPWLPEPIADVSGLSPESAAEFADDLSFALLMILEKLSPPERAAFLLHDVFDAPFLDVANALGRSESACRQLASRARRAVREQKAPTKVAPETHSALLMKFAEAAASGDAKSLEALLAADAVAWSDGGGVKRAALNPIIGAGKVARFFTGLAAKTARGGAKPTYEIASINGAPGLLIYIDGALDQTLSLECDGERITSLYLVRNPEKLRTFLGKGPRG
jgi:RNA polymerase sigma-70 factor (ECF subfamily)